MMLELPDIRQRDGHDCGDAVLRIVWDYYQVRSRPRVATPIDGTSPDTLESTLWQSGLHVIAGVMTLDDLRFHVRQRRPVICCTNDNGVGHWVVVSGVTRRKVFFQCPVLGRTAVPEQQFLSAWSDTTRRGVVYPRWGIAVCLP